MRAVWPFRNGSRWTAHEESTTGNVADLDTTAGANASDTDSHATDDGQENDRFDELMDILNDEQALYRMLKRNPNDMQQKYRTLLKQLSDHFPQNTTPEVQEPVTLAEGNNLRTGDRVAGAPMAPKRSIQDAETTPRKRIKQEVDTRGNDPIHEDGVARGEENDAFVEASAHGNGS